MLCVCFDCVFGTYRSTPEKLIIGGIWEVSNDVLILCFLYLLWVPIGIHFCNCCESKLTTVAKIDFWFDDLHRKLITTYLTNQRLSPTCCTWTHITWTHLFGTKDYSYDLKVHGPVHPKAAQNVVTRSRAGVSDQEVSIPLKQRLCRLNTSQQVKWISWG